MTAVFAISDEDISDALTPVITCVNGVIIASSEAQMDCGGSVVIIRQRPADLAPLNSSIDVGPFRFAAQKQADETSMITSLIVGVEEYLGSPDTTEDWGAEADETEDWNLAPDTFEDWGVAGVFPDLFSLELMATDDGITPQLQGVEVLDLVVNRNDAYQYSPGGYSAIMHRMRFNATELNSKFNLKYIDLGGTLTGRAL